MGQKPEAGSRKKIVCLTIDQLPDIANEILGEYHNKRVFALFGKMGVGKTTLIKEFCKTLGVEDTTSSPSFAIINQYRSKKGNNIFHFDFYRIKSQEEAMDIGYEDYFYSGDYCFIEWPEKIENLLPENFVYIRIVESENDGSRIIHLH
jgi:tRNA threonylcarbamoyladenosine biosynthesis protein TsaE